MFDLNELSKSPTCDLNKKFFMWRIILIGTCVFCSQVDKANAYDPSNVTGANRKKENITTTLFCGPRLHFQTLLKVSLLNSFNMKRRVVNTVLIYASKLQKQRSLIPSCGVKRETRQGSSKS